MTEDITQTLTEIEKDITYFKNLGFEHLVEKFERDKRAIQSLIN